MPGKKRMKFRGIKHAPKRLESDILERSKNLWENPDLVRPKCAGKCLLCPFKGSFAKMEKLGSVKNDSDALVKLASKGSDDLFKAYCGTISLYAAGSIPYLATAKLAGEDVSFAQRGSVGNDKLIGMQYYNDPKIRLLLYASITKSKGLHIYSYEDEIICSKKPNTPADYVYDTFWDSPYEFPDDELVCGHDADAALVIKIASCDKEIRICRNCAKEVSTVQFLISRMISADPLDDITVSVEHKYHKEGESGSVVITDKEVLGKYMKGLMTDVSVINSVIKDKIGSLKSADSSTYIIGSKNYGSDLESFLKDLSGTDLENKALKAYLLSKNRTIILRTNKTSEALTAVWDDYRNVIASFTNDNIADSFGDVSKMVPSTVVKEAYNKHISFDVVSQLPEFKKAGPVTTYADRYAKAVKVGGADMLKEELEKLVPKDKKTKSLAKAFGDIAGCPYNAKLTPDEEEFANYLKPFVKQLVDANGEDYRYCMNTVLTATGCGEKV